MSEILSERNQPQRSTCPGRWVLAVVATVLVAGGCGSKVPHADQPWSNVTITVTAGGQPLEVGEVTLLATKGSSGVDAGGLLDTAGAAMIPALPGSYVAVIRPLPPPPEGTATDAGAAADATGAGSIPKRYRSPATSPFAVEIRRGEKNVFTFDLAP